VVLLAVATIVLLTAAGGAAGAARPARLAGGDPLQRLRTEERLGGARVAPTVVRAALPRSTAAIWLVLASVSMLAVVVPGVISKRPLRLAQVGVPSPEGGVQMRRFIDRKAREAQEGSTEGVQEEVRDPNAPSPISRVADYTGEPLAAREPQQIASEPVASFGELGQHVTSILEAARESAEHMLSEARDEAKRVEERSQKEAEAALAEARRKAGELEAEANQTHSEARRTARELRTRADEYAEEKRQEADEAAAQIEAQAERAARERTASAEERQRVLAEHVERTEERLRQLVGGLRELAGRLEVLVGGDGQASTEADGERSDLEEELRQSAADHGLTRETEAHADREP
jgi:cell division septum initiation protein DivIVA